MNFKSKVTCSHCAKILKDPIQLPCDHNICERHLKEPNIVEQNQIRCLTCDLAFNIRENIFKPNYLATALLDDFKFLSVEEISSKRDIEDSIRELFKLQEKLIEKNKFLVLDNQKHFQDVRKQIDFHREKLKEKIDEIYMEMIDKTNEYEASYLKSLNEKLEASSKSFKIESVEEELQNIEEKFRDPNLLFESIQEIQLKQEEAISLLQSKLNDLNSFKINLTSITEFKPNLAFHQDLFGSLKLNGHSNIDPFESLILKGEQPFELISLCEFIPKDKFKLLYRASRDGFGIDDFHSRCDGFANILIIFKASETSFIFGAFTSNSFESFQPSQYKLDTNAFLFSLVNKLKRPTKMSIVTNQQEYAIYCNSRSGLVFGSGHDISIGDNANMKAVSSSNLGQTYKHPHFAKGTTEAQSFLAGSQYFQLSEIEVYQKE